MVKHGLLVWFFSNYTNLKATHRTKKKKFKSNPYPYLQGSSVNSNNLHYLSTGEKSDVDPPPLSSVAVSLSVAWSSGSRASFSGTEVKPNISRVITSIKIWCSGPPSYRYSSLHLLYHQHTALNTQSLNPLQFQDVCCYGFATAKWSMTTT